MRTGETGPPGDTTLTFVRRHRLGVAAAVAVLLALAGGLVATAWQAREAARARDQARREARRAEEVSDFLVGLFEAPDPTTGPAETLTARALLERGADRMEEELRGDPESRARLYDVMGRVFGNLGRTDTATALLRASVELRKGLYGEESLEAAEGMSALADRLRNDRAFGEAESLHREALEIRLREHPDTTPAVTAEMIDLGHALAGAGRPDSGAVLVRRGLERLRMQLGPDHPRTLAAATGLASIRRAQDRLEEAEALYRDALPRLRALDRDHWPELARALDNYAYLLRERKAYGEAERAYRESLGLLRSRLGPGHPRTALVMANLASVLEIQGKYASAEALLRERHRAVRERWPADHWRVGRAARYVGTLLVRDGRPVEAEELLRRALSVYERALGPGHPWTADTRSRLAACLAAQGRYAEAEPLARSALDRLRSEQGPVAPRTREARERLVRLYEAWGRPEMAERHRVDPLVAERSGDAGGPGGP